MDIIIVPASRQCFLRLVYDFFMSKYSPKDQMIMRRKFRKNVEKNLNIVDRLFVDSGFADNQINSA